jgi:hypothetical protein
LKDYIQGVCDVNHYSVYKSFLEIPLDENLDYNHIITKINNAFFRLEAFMKGTINDYFHFDFSRAFTELFYYTRKPDNFTYENCKRVGQYWELTEQIRYDYDKYDFENHDAYKNKAFCKDCEILMSINWDRIEEFTSFATPDELESQTKKKTVADLMNPSIQNQKVVYVDKPLYEQELLNTTNATKNFAIDKVDITYLNGVFRENEDILPKSILNAFNSIGNIKSLYITEDESEIINTYEDDLDPFDNLPGTTVIEYYCIESNYLNLISKIEDKTFIFCDNLPLDLYMFEYAKAFQKAYSDFEKNLAQKQTTIAEPQEQKALKIFSFVLNAKFKNGYFGDNTEALEYFKDKKGRYISNEEFSEWGGQGGQYYKAWEIILNNPVVFEPFFLKYFHPSVANEIVLPESSVNNNEVIKQQENNNEESVTLENPYPKIFKDYKAFIIFKNLQEEFSNTKENLSNYSFIFHKMTYEDLIHFDLKQQSYFDLLDKFDININRIKPLCDIGKIAFRESIYTKAK